MELNLYTSLELQMLRNAVGPGTQLPGVDYKVGNLLPTSSLVSVKTLMSGPGWSYDPKTDLVRIWGDNVTLSGIDFGSAEVMMWGNNVTLKNCTFEPSPTSLNWYCVYQYGSGGTIENCTFTGQPVVMRQGGIGTTTAHHGQEQYPHQCCRRRHRCRGGRDGHGQLHFRRRVLGGS